MVSIQQKSEKINMQVKTFDDQYVQNIESKIIDILNKNKVTSEEFDKIIEDLLEYKKLHYYDSSQLYKTEDLMFTPRDILVVSNSNLEW